MNSLFYVRFNIQSRYKIGLYHPKPREKPVVRIPDKSVVQKRSSEIKSTPATSLINEDELSTMVQLVHDEDVQNGTAAVEPDVKKKLQPLLENLLVEIASKSKVTS